MIEVIAVIVLTLPNNSPAEAYIRPSQILTLYNDPAGHCSLNMRDDLKLKIAGPCESIIKKAGWAVPQK